MSSQTLAHRRPLREAIPPLWLDGLSTAEIAERLDSTPQTISGVVTRLRAEGMDLPYRYRQREPAHAATLPPDDRQRCSACGETKPLDEFKRTRRRPTGRCSTCRACHRRYNRERSQDPVYKARHREAQRQWAERNPEKVAAHAAARSLRGGDRPCERCGDSRAHAHHPDYSRPLDVRWLCPPCHQQLHAGEWSL